MLNSEISRRSGAHVRFIAELSVALSRSLDRSTTISILAGLAVEEFCELCVVVLVDDEGSLATCAFEDLQHETSGKARDAFSRMLLFGNGPVQEAMRAGVPLQYSVEAQISSVSGDDALRFLRVSGRREMIVAPLVIGTACVGAACFVESRPSRRFDPDDVQIATIVARQLALTLENIESHERERQVSERFRFMARATDQLFASHEESEMLDLLTRAIVDELADFACVVRLDSSELRLVAAAQSPAAGSDPPVRIGSKPFNRPSEIRAVESLRERRSMLFGKAAPSELRQTFRQGFASVIQRLGAYSWIMAPLFVGDRAFGGVLCFVANRRYDRSDLDLVEEIGRRTSLALEYAESFARERRLARTLQQATLPSQLAPIGDALLSAVYTPAAAEEQVGGDWYDVFNVDNHRVLLTIGDVTGHGLQASVIMGKLRHTLNVVAMYENDAVRIIDVAERVVLRRYPDTIATAFVALLDVHNHTIEYANAGHPWPIVRMRDGTLRTLSAYGLPIGLRNLGAPHPTVKESLEDVDFMTLYTDGLIEGRRDTISGEARLRETLETDALLYVRDAAVHIGRLCLPEPAHDDVAVLTVNFLRVQRWSFESDDAPSAQTARREFIAALPYTDGTDASVAETIFGELVANVARHAPGNVEVALELKGADPVLHVVDYGAGIATAEPEVPDLLEESGRGLLIVRHLSRGMEIEVVPDLGTHVSVVLPPVPL
jgi:GAF domain-containing protein/anti-sigma regulatory factor (Ser/Thr protein kinase)